MTRVSLFLTLFISLLGFSELLAKPLKIYILAGQSNMSGYGNLKTLDYMKRDPVTVSILNEIVDEKGESKIIENVWISQVHKSGKLSTGYGANRGGPKIGPELTFGIYMHKIVKEPILIIKTSWGATSLHTDWRSPSAGPFKFSNAFLSEGKMSEQELAKLKEQKVEKSGKQYRLMMDHVKKVLADVKKAYPNYNEKEGYVVEGFVWFQGVHDLIDKATYPKAGKSNNAHGEYTRLLSCLIRDVRKEINAPKMKVVIGEIGLNGDFSVKPNDQFVSLLTSLRKAQADTAKLNEFKGSVISIDTSKYWDNELEELQGRWSKFKGITRPIERDKSLKGEKREQAIVEGRRKVYTDEEWEKITKGTSHAGYHYMGSAKIYAQIGKAFAEAMASF